MAGSDNGTWTTVQVDITQLIAVIDPVLTGAETIFEILITALNVAQAILEVVKTFIVGLLNPVSQLVEELVALIQGFLADLRNIGLYLYIGDGNLLKPNFSALLGGYAAFENRMIRSLVNTRDRSRPQATNSTAVIGVFFYISVDVSLIYEILTLAAALNKFFGRKGNFSPFVAPVQLNVSYGNPNLGLASFANVLKKSAFGQAAAVSWKMPSGSQVTGQRIPPVGGFIIEVSTVPDGITALASAPITTASASGAIVGRKEMVVVDGLTGQPVVVYGGTDSIQSSTNSNANAGQLSFVSNQNSPAVPVNALREYENTSQKRFFGRSFFVKNRTLRALPPGQGFVALLKAADLPYTGDVTFLPKTNEDDLYGQLLITNAYQPSTYYVVVRAVDKQRADLIMANVIDGEATSGNPATFDYPLYPIVGDRDIKQASTTTDALSLLNTTGTGTFGVSSLPIPVNFPRDSRTFDILQTAVLIAILSRSDLTVNTAQRTDGDAKLPTGLEDLMKKQFKELDLNRQFFVRYKDSPSEFAKALLAKSAAVTSTLLKSPLMSQNPTVVLTVGLSLLDFRWSDTNPNFPKKTILESLQDTANGVSSDVWSTGITDNTARVLAFGDPRITLVGVGIPLALASSIEFNRTPQFWAWADLPVSGFRGNLPELGYALKGAVLTDYSPTVRNVVDGAFVGAFCRNAIPDEVYSTTKQVLQLVTTPSSAKMVGVSQDWVAIRLLPNGIPQIDRLLSNLDTFFQSVLAGFEDVSGAIVRYIEFIQAKIRNLQAILDQIQGLIDYIRGLTLPPVSALVITEEGIGGLISGLAGAENKPQDSSLSYGFGFAAVGIGLPVILMDLLNAVFGATSASSSGA